MSFLLIFDLDGTLVDSKLDIATSLNYALIKEGFSPLPQKQIEDLVGWGARRLVQKAIGDPNDEEMERVFGTFWNHYDEHLLDQTTLYPAVISFLEESEGWHKAVITNKPHNFTQKIVKGLKIDPYFRWIISGDTTPAQKPNPDVLEPIRKELGEISEGIIVGDSIVDIEFGKAAGLATCAVTQGFGLLEDLEATQPDYIVSDFEELARLPIFKRD